jgi:hypothetical protein
MTTRDQPATSPLILGKDRSQQRRLPIQALAGYDKRGPLMTRPFPHASNLLEPNAVMPFVIIRTQS